MTITCEPHILTVLTVKLTQKNLLVICHKNLKPKGNFALLRMTPNLNYSNDLDNAWTYSMVIKLLLLGCIWSHIIYYFNLCLLWFWDLMLFITQVDKEGVASWVLSLQSHPASKADLDNGTNFPCLHSLMWSHSNSMSGKFKLPMHCMFAPGQFYGFHGSRTSQFPPDGSKVWEPVIHWLSYWFVYF